MSISRNGLPADDRPRAVLAALAPEPPAWAVTICRNLFLNQTRRLAVCKHRPLQKEHDDGSTTDRPEPQLAIAPLRESHVTAQEMAQDFDRLVAVHKDTLKRRA